ncbi:hypothetical protein PFISCL1PPCAC_4323, partial [Pristionchus fissidentatus]
KHLSDSILQNKIQSNFLMTECEILADGERRVLVLQFVHNFVDFLIEDADADLGERGAESIETLLVQCVFENLDLVDVLAHSLLDETLAERAHECCLVILHFGGQLRSEKTDDKQGKQNNRSHLSII